jgi:hypothetical protein
MNRDDSEGSSEEEILSEARPDLLKREEHLRSATRIFSGEPEEKTGKLPTNLPASSSSQRHSHSFVFFYVSEA